MSVICHLIEDHEAEATMISAIATTPTLLDEYPLTEEFFTAFECKSVFTVMSHINRNGGVISVHSVAMQLGAGNVQAIGGLHKIEKLMEYVHDSVAGVAYERLSNSLMLRRVRSVVGYANAALNAPKTTEEVSELVVNLVKKAEAVDVDSDCENMLFTASKSILDRLERMDKGEHEFGFKTTVRGWNDSFGGLFNGAFYAIAGRPGTGKTALMEQFLMDYIMDGRPVAVFERDMSPTKLVERLACRMSGVPHWRFYRGFVNKDETQRIRYALHNLTDGSHKGTLKVFSPSGLTAREFCAVSRREIRASGVECVFLDHLGALNVGRGKDDRHAGLVSASIEIRNHVTDTDVPHVVLVHLNREGASGKPRPENIKECDQLYGDVDGMLILWNEGEASKEGKRKVNFFAAKNREGGETDDSMWFDGPAMKFTDEAQ